MKSSIKLQQIETKDAIGTLLAWLNSPAASRVLYSRTYSRSGRQYWFS